MGQQHHHSATPTRIAPICIAVDAMGGDFAPYEIIRGAVLGARQHGVAIQLVGPPAEIEPHLKTLDTTGLNIAIVPASEVIAMDEHPAIALRKKKDASITVTAKCVASGDAQAMVAAGSTGAAMAAALFKIGRINGVERPAIGLVLPSTAASPCMLIDAGANADCTPEMLNQFAHMGSVFIQNVYGVANPRVGLLNIGEEEGKGNAFVNETFPVLRDDPALNFIGNIEGRDLFLGGADVAVCDGFTGNVALKSAEGLALMMTQFMKEEFSRTWLTKLGALLAKQAFKNIRKRVHPDEYGGALLLGIKGICVISHGGSKANAVQNAIRVAKEAVEADVLAKIGHQILQRCEVSP